MNGVESGGLIAPALHRRNNSHSMIYDLQDMGLVLDLNSASSSLLDSNHSFRPSILQVKLLKLYAKAHYHANLT